MKRTARKYRPASRTESTLLIVAGIVTWALILAPVVWWLGAMLGR